MIAIGALKRRLCQTPNLQKGAWHKRLYNSKPEWHGQSPYLFLSFRGPADNIVTIFNFPLSLRWL
jgi:hypothetical protein